jgi:hypothetical protein
MLLLIVFYLDPSRLGTAVPIGLVTPEGVFTDGAGQFKDETCGTPERSSNWIEA